MFTAKRVISKKTTTPIRIETLVSKCKATKNKWDDAGHAMNPFLYPLKLLLTEVVLNCKKGIYAQWCVVYCNCKAKHHGHKTLSSASLDCACCSNVIRCAFWHRLSLDVWMNVRWIGNLILTEEQSDKLKHLTQLPHINDTAKGNSAMHIARTKRWYNRLHLCGSCHAKW